MLEEALSKLSSTLRGSVITPASGEYEAARKVYNGMIDRRPDAIVCCANVADVRAAVISRATMVSRWQFAAGATMVPVWAYVTTGL